MYEPTSGYADPVATTYAYANRAMDYGAEIVTGCAVSGIRVQGGRIVGVDTEEGPVEADAVVAAIGPWVNQLATPLGESLPITPIRVQMVHLRRPPSLEALTTNVIDYTTGAYFRVDAGYGTLVGGENLDDLNEVVNPDGFGLNADHNTITKFWDRAKLRFPDFSAATQRGGYGSLYDMAPDGNPILDKSASVEWTVLGGRVQRTRLQAVTCGWSYGGGVRYAWRKRRSLDTRLPREPIRGRRSAERGASLRRTQTPVGDRLREFNRALLGTLCYRLPR